MSCAQLHANARSCIAVQTFGEDLDVALDFWWFVDVECCGL
jgi:hypothetical protein